MHKKIKTQKEIVTIAETLRKEGKQVVAVSGAFDLLHIGHVTFLKKAKEQGDVLIVLQNTDASVKRYKGSERPIIPQEERIEVIAALESVDYVVLFDEDTPIRLLNKLKPQLFCNGSDWGKECIEKDVCEISVIPLIEGCSTTNIIQKIHKLKNGNL